MAGGLQVRGPQKLNKTGSQIRNKKDWDIAEWYSTPGFNTQYWGWGVHRISHELSMWHLHFSCIRPKQPVRKHFTNDVLDCEAVDVYPSECSQFPQSFSLLFSFTNRKRHSTNFSKDQARNDSPSLRNYFEITPLFLPFLSHYGFEYLFSTTLFIIS